MSIRDILVDKIAAGNGPSYIMYFLSSNTDTVKQLPSSYNIGPFQGKHLKWVLQHVHLI